MKNITQEDFQEGLNQDDNAVLLDVRTHEEVVEGAIPDAKNIDIYHPQEFMGEVEKLDKSKNYYV